jgi:hypothetical protein
MTAAKRKRSGCASIGDGVMSDPKPAYRRCAKSRWCLSDNGHLTPCRGPLGTALRDVSRLVIVSMDEAERLVKALDGDGS